MVIAGSIASQSIGLLLLAGLIPGLFIAAMLMVYNHFYSVRKGVCQPTPFNGAVLLRAGVRAILPMMTPVILMIGILDGFFTPTEAAAIAVVYTFAIAALVYRRIKWRDIFPMLMETARTSGNILFIAATAKLAGWVFAYDGLPVKVGNALGSITTNPMLIMLLIFLFLVVVGMFMDAIAAMYILIPVLLPPAVALDVDPIHLLVIIVITLTLGLVTPPVGVCLFAVSKVANMSIEDVIKGSVGPVSILIVAILALVLFPVLVIGPLRLFGMY
jgi:tripartite ATP-independent transporter DctM subunit